MNKVAVIGFGLTGRAVVKFLLKKRADITVFDEKSRSEFEDIGHLEKKGVRFNFGPFDFEKIAKAELIVMSPGVSAFKFPEFKKLEQQGKEVISEIELAWRFFKGKLITITGTNGKSTTATLVHHLFGTATRKSFLLGNIDTPFIKEVENIGPREYAVVEVSCFQLEEIKSFKPNYVILTNISADHLDRYPSMESYVETRKNIFKNITSEDKIILNFDDPLIQKHFTESVKGEIYWFSRKSEVPRGAFLRGNNFIFRDNKRERSFFNLSDFSLPGLHNIENALAASLPLVLEGIEIGLIQKGLKDFKGLKHRMEFVARFEGVDFVNDSKATNVDAVLKAVLSLNSTSDSTSGKIVLIMGGKDKGGDFSLLKSLLNDTLIPLHPKGHRRAQAGTSTLSGTGKPRRMIAIQRGKIEIIVLMGEATSKICAQLNGVIRIKKARSMEEAVRLSFEEAKPKGVVLLSPGCASFDMFNNFEHRGEVFREEVMRLKERDLPR